MRAFISFNLSRDVKDEFKQVQEGLIEAIEPAYPACVRWETKEKFHLTLFFLGDINDEEIDEITKELNAIKSLFKENEIKFISDYIDAFPDKKWPIILFAGLENPDNNGIALAEALRAGMKKFGFFGFKDKKPFHPHITLGRVRKDKRLNLNKIDTHKFKVEFTCKEFYLMESKPGTSGSVYCILKSFVL